MRTLASGRRSTLPPFSVLKKGSAQGPVLIGRLGRGALVAIRVAAVTGAASGSWAAEGGTAVRDAAPGLSRQDSDAVSQHRPQIVEELLECLEEFDTDVRADHAAYYSTAT